MKKRRPRKRLPGNSAPTTKIAKTGEHCPTTGWWMTSGEMGDKRFVAEGCVMPANRGQPATWTLTDSGDFMAESGTAVSAPAQAFAKARYSVPNHSPDQWHPAGMPLDVLEYVPVRKATQSAKRPPEFPVSCDESCFYCQAPEID